MSDNNGILDLSLIVGFSVEIHLTPWDQGISWIHKSSDGEFISEYHEDVVLPFTLLIRQPSLGAWQGSIPKDIQLALDQFEASFSDYTFTVLWFASRSNSAIQLLKSSPILIWMVMHYSVQNKLASNDVFGLFDYKRIEILRLLQFPAKKSILRFLNKYEFNNFDISGLKVLQKFLRHHEMKAVSRIQNIHMDLMKWLIVQPMWINAGFVQSLKKTASIPILRTYVQDTLIMGEQLQQEDIKKRILTRQTVAELYTLHDRLVELINVRDVGKNSHVEYQYPPIEGSDVILPILNYEDLNREGMTMKHCIVSYHERIIENEYFVFRMVQPERVTIGVHYINGKLAIDQIRSNRNQIPSDEVKEIVYCWFHNNRAL